MGRHLTERIDILQAYIFLYYFTDPYFIFYNEFYYCCIVYTITITIRQVRNFVNVCVLFLVLEFFIVDPWNFIVRNLNTWNNLHSSTRLIIRSSRYSAAYLVIWNVMATGGKVFSLIYLKCQGMYVCISIQYSKHYALLHLCLVYAYWAGYEREFLIFSFTLKIIFTHTYLSCMGEMKIHKSSNSHYVTTSQSHSLAVCVNGKFLLLKI